MQATRRTPPTPERVQVRAISRFTLQAPTGCHLSTYSVGGHGYAQVGWRIEGETRTATVLCHRAAWELVHGPIPEGMTVDHLCKTRRCVNVEHLRILTNHENARRTSGRDWPLGYCANGHPNSDLHTQASGRRVCTPCHNDWQRRYNDKKRAA